MGEGHFLGSQMQIGPYLVFVEQIDLRNPTDGAMRIVVTGRILAVTARERYVDAEGRVVEPDEPRALGDGG